MALTDANVKANFMIYLLFFAFCVSVSDYVTNAQTGG